MKFKKILYFTICFILIIAFVFLITTAYFRLNVLTSESNVSENTHTVIIDAGHGGEDGGAVNDNNVVEKDLNLQISVKLALEKSGGNITQAAGLLGISRPALYARLRKYNLK